MCFNNHNNFILFIKGCQPYLIKPLSKTDIHKSSTQCLQTPACIKNKCTNPTYMPIIGDNKPMNFKSI